ncbi:uncharacterized protein LOC129321643 isoform X1 [Prosopis cineraria]|uniref:uncharacterized protein LOC129321643 isoform X1 n=1 Tax=Prosopis cineraria TaxID=364024 RepID=UPI0024109488|nr:uncharacterized protein LOC129321643 isoform X1 [Prosopis cineraria]
MQHALQLHQANFVLLQMGFRVPSLPPILQPLCSSSSSSTSSRFSSDPYREEQVEIWRRRDEEEVDCAVCLSQIGEGDELRVLRCEHAFHRLCLNQWVGLRNYNCPLFRDFLGSGNMVVNGVKFLAFSGDSERDNWWLRFFILLCSMLFNYIKLTSSYFKWVLEFPLYQHFAAFVFIIIIIIINLFKSFIRSLQKKNKWSQEIWRRRDEEEVDCAACLSKID